MNCVFFCKIVSIGHETVMARTTFFGTNIASVAENRFDFSQEYLYQKELHNYTVRESKLFKIEIKFCIMSISEYLRIHDYIDYNYSF